MSRAWRFNLRVSSGARKVVPLEKMEKLINESEKCSVKSRTYLYWTLEPIGLSSKAIIKALCFEEVEEKSWEKA
jgi:hypothetical protein